MTEQEFEACQGQTQQEWEAMPESVRHEWFVEADRQIAILERQVKWKVFCECCSDPKRGCVLVGAWLDLQLWTMRVLVHRFNFWLLTGEIW